MVIYVSIVFEYLHDNIGDLVPQIHAVDFFVAKRGTNLKPSIVSLYVANEWKVTMHSLKCCVPIQTCITTILLSKQCHE